MGPFYNPLRLDNVKFACISVFSLAFSVFVLYFSNLFCAITLQSCITSLAVMFVFFFLQFSVVDNTIINPKPWPQLVCESLFFITIA